MARALIDPEPALLRGPRQRTRLFVDADLPPVVFACRVNQSFTSKDMVLEVIYDLDGVTIEGVYTDVLAGMTILIGSSQGDDDLGSCRARKSEVVGAAADATHLYIGLTSEIVWADNIFMTVIADWCLWAKPLVVNEGEAVLVDGETAYNGQNANFAPVIVAGPARRVARLEGDYVDVAFDLSGSWVLGSSISSRSVSAPGGTVTGGGTATPVVRYAATGRYWIAFTAGAVNGKSSTAYRTVRIFSDADPLLTVFGPPEGSGDYDDGGWRLGLNVYLPQSTLEVIRKHAMITLVAEDWYDDTKISIGPVAGSENVVAIGWLATDEIRANPRTGGTARLEVLGPQAWLDRIGTSMLGLNNATATPGEWNEVQQLTVDKALQHIITWRSTIAAVMDVYRSDDGRIADIFPNSETTLWGQLAAIGARILARPLCDRYGRLFLRIDPQFVAEDDRSAFPTVMTVEKGDWRDELVMRQNMEQVTQLLQVASLAGGGEQQAIYSLAAGHILKHFGSQAVSAEADLIVASQEQANEIAGLRLGRANREFDFEIPLAQNNRMVDICPEQYVGLTLEAGDTPRGIEFDGRIVVRHIELKYEMKSGFLWFEWSGEQETFAENTVNGDIPVGDELPTMPVLPPLPPLPPLPTDPVLEESPVGEDGPPNVVLAIPGKGIWYTQDFDTEKPHWYGWSSGLDTDAIDHIWAFDISKTSGLAILHTQKYGGEGRLWVSQGPGEEWTLLAGSTTSPVVMAAALNRGVDDEIAAILQSGWNQPGRWYVGTSEGLTAKALTGFNAHCASPMVYGAGVWTAWNSWIPVALLQANRDGTFLRATNYGNGSGAGGYLSRGNVNGATFIMWNRSPGFACTPDNGLNFIEINTSPPARWEGVGADPLGRYIMVSQTYITVKSSDHGATFGTIIGAYGNGAVWNLGDSQNWLIQTGLTVYFSHDFGTTWVDRRGDLQTQLGIGWLAVAVRNF